MAPDPESGAPPHVFSQGFCEHPIQLLGTPVDSATGEVLSGKEAIFFRACGNRRHRVCVACSEVYQRDAWHVVHSGMNELHRPLMFLTLTAPGMGRLKKDASRISCKHHNVGKCLCGNSHKLDSAQVGAPLDPKRFDYPYAARWNAASSLLWEDFMRRWRRARYQRARKAGANPSLARKYAQVAYVRVNEHHRRGLLHMHVVIRGAHDESLIRTAAEEARAELEDQELRFGTNLEVELVPAGDVEKRRRIANYFAKYLTKGLADTIEGKGDRRKHLQRLRGNAYTQARGRRPRCWSQLQKPDQTCTCVQCAQAFRHRQRATEMLGHGGHVFSKSSAHGRKWGKTMGECREARRSWRQSQVPDDAVIWLWDYIMRGYGSSAEETAARRLAEAYREARERPPPHAEGVSAPASASPSPQPLAERRD